MYTCDVYTGKTNVNHKCSLKYNVTLTSTVTPDSRYHYNS